MAKTYKVWVHIEEYDEDEGEYQDIDLPEDLGEFETLKEATEFVSKLCAVPIE